MTRSITADAARWLVLIGAAGALLFVVLVGTARTASAQAFGTRELGRGSSGPDVLEVQIRVAGWYGNCAGISCHDHFHLDGKFGPKTERAVKNFEKAHNEPTDGVVRGNDFHWMLHLENSDRSTRNFDWSEFTEKSASCSTGNKGTFNGGRVGASTVKENVRRLMYRLEVVRHKMDNRYPMYVSSGFRSTKYQDCLRSKNGGGTVARNSQHSYGTAFDGLMSGINLGRHRGLAKTSELHAIFCYGSSKHNHLDIRLDNGAYNAGGRFAWPRTSSSGKDLDANGKTCYGGHSSPPSTGVKPPAVGLPLPDPWGLTSDPTAPTDTEGQFYQDTSEEIWFIEDHDNPLELLNAVCHCVPEIHHDHG